MGNLVIAIIGVLFSVALMTAGISYISPNIGIVANNSASVDDEITGLLSDYQTLRTNVQHVPTVSDYAAVYKSGSSSSTLVSRNSLYAYNGASGSLTRVSALPGTGAGWTFNSSCNAANNAPCFCLTVTPSGNATASDKATYRSALVAARKLTTGSGSSQVAYNPNNPNGCSVTGALQYGAWPDPNTATPTQPYTLVVATVGTPSIGSCTCTQGTQTYACGANWDVPQPANSQPCPNPPWASGTESQTVEIPWSCVEQPGGTGSLVGPGTAILGAWSTSNCVAPSVTPACISPLPSPSSAAPAGNLCAQGTQAGAPQPSGGNWTWTCTGSGTSSINCSSPAIVDGQCNTISTPTSTAPNSSTPECLSGTANPSPATTSSDTNWHWNCVGSSNGSTAACTAPGLCTASAPVGGSISFPGCVPTCPGSEVDVNNVCVAAVKGQCGISVDTCNAGTVTNPQTYSTYSQWYCDGNTGNASDNSPLCGACNPGYTWNAATSTCVTVITGQCGTALDSCKAGTITGLQDYGSYSQWTCAGNTGNPSNNSPLCGACDSNYTWNSTTSTCDAEPAICNTFGAMGPPGPTGSLCIVGTASTVTQSGTNWAWTCTDAADDPAVSCSARAILPGQCGSDVGKVFSTLPWYDGNPYDAANTCLGGATYAVNGATPTGEYTWICNGANGGLPSSQCTACQTGYAWNGSGCAASTKAICPAVASVSWGQTSGSGNCSSPLPQGTAGNVYSLTNTASGYTGTEGADCNINGSWSYFSPSCTAVATPACGTDSTTKFPRAYAPWLVTSPTSPQVCQTGTEANGTDTPGGWTWNCVTGTGSSQQTVSCSTGFQPVEVSSNINGSNANYPNGYALAYSYDSNTVDSKIGNNYCHYAGFAYFNPNSIGWGAGSCNTCHYSDTYQPGSGTNGAGGTWTNFGEECNGCAALTELQCIDPGPNTPPP